MRQQVMHAADPLFESIQALLAEHRIRYVSADELSIERRRRGRGFVYRDAGGVTVRDLEAIARFRSLAVPPAWRQVRLAPEPAWHLQALGHDAAGRMQRRYHESWDAIRNAAKRIRLVRFAQVLPRIRAAVAADLARPFGDRDGLCATAVRLIDLAHLRPGSETALREIGSRGVTTLAPANVTISGPTVKLSFRGKSGQWVDCEVRDALLSRRIEQLKDRNRRRLFRLTRGDRDCLLSCADLNGYLQRVARLPVSAKDFRTWDASATALWHLLAEPLPASARGRNRILAALARTVAERLGNTPSIARNSYIHPSVPDAWLAGAFEGGTGPALRRAARATRWLAREEVALRRFLAATAAGLPLSGARTAKAARRRAVARGRGTAPRVRAGSSRPAP
ncbi:MAG: DNA topoisomerase IB [Lautropia sp.]